TFEAIECLRGKLDGDFPELCLELAAQMIITGGIVRDAEAARDQARRAIKSGNALERFRAVIDAQGGDPRVLDNPKLLPQANKQLTITADRAGFVDHIETTEIGRVIMAWGGGRSRLEDKIDYGIGLYIHAKLGDYLNRGDPSVTAYYNDESKIEEMTARLQAAVHIAESPPNPEPMIKAVICK
ncbi:MAG: pyrimidine-nucleoside phosphorylase, partial [Acidobacteria bacterium]|nr:pyrimidine-nucleoside phosphorylase [Acidobacteriota bacterium]